MKTIQKSLILASLLLASMTASAQKVIVQDLESWMGSLISRAIDNKVEVSKSFGHERDIQKEGTPLKWRCDIITFMLPKKQRPLLDEMIKAFEENGHSNPLCYGINTLTTGNLQNEGLRNLIIGEDLNRYVTIGKQYGNYINVNFLDAADTTKTHRYAYALEWKEDYKGNIFVRYIVTYAKIPMQQPTVTYTTSVNFGSSAFDNDKFLTIFYNLTDSYQKNKLSITAVSIFNLCNIGRAHGVLSSPEYVDDLDSVKNTLKDLQLVAGTANDREMFQKALEAMEEIKTK